MRRWVVRFCNRSGVHYDTLLTESGEMPDRVVYFNGEFVPEREARVSIFDSALQFGDMAYESTRTFGGRPFHLREHLERLFGTLAAIEVDCRLSLDELERITLETLARNAPTESGEMEWQIVHNVSRGPSAAYRAAFAGSNRPTVLIYCWPLVATLGRLAPNYETGAELVIPAQRHIPASLLNPHAKTRSRAHSQLAMLQAARIRPGSWPVLVDPDGFLTEGPTWNIFLVRDGVLLTPTARNILKGVSRRITLQIASELEIDAREADLRRDDALSADEIFCTATSFCLVHAATFEGRTVGDGRPGPMFQRLAEGWKKAVGLDFAVQARRFAKQLPEWERRERESLSRQSNGKGQS